MTLYYNIDLKVISMLKFTPKVVFLHKGQSSSKLVPIFISYEENLNFPV